MKKAGLVLDWTADFPESRFLSNPCCSNSSDAILSGLVIGGYELLVKQLEIIKQFSFCTHVHLTINESYCNLITV
jgi:hypothetical protein